MAKHSRTWWGQKFISALESFTDSGRLQRGRAYSGDSRILHFDITKGLATATIRGNVNPYFQELHSAITWLLRLPWRTYWQ